MRIEIPRSSAVIINVPPSLQLTVDEQFSNRSEIPSDSDEVFAKWSLSDISSMAGFLKVLDCASQRYDSWLKDIKDIFPDLLIQQVPRKTLHLSNTKEHIDRLLRHTSIRLRRASGAEAMALARIVIDLAGGYFQNDGHLGASPLAIPFIEYTYSAAQCLERGGDLGAVLAIQSYLLARSIDGSIALGPVDTMIVIMELQDRFRRRIDPLILGFHGKISPEGFFSLANWGSWKRKWIPDWRSSGNARTLWGHHFSTGS